jgi:hypothetical protein
MATHRPPQTLPQAVRKEERLVAETEEKRAGKPMPEDAEFLRAQARKCRWLAQRIETRDVAETLRQMAREYDGRADRLSRQPREG